MEEEFNRLQREGVIYKVERSDYGTPIVPVVKNNNGSIQPCLLHEESQPMTAITTHIGTFVYKRVPLGIKRIPENFQKIMEETLSGLPATALLMTYVLLVNINMCICLI